MLRLLSCPHRDDHPGDLVHGKGWLAGLLHQASAPARRVGLGGTGGGDVKVVGELLFRGAFNCELRPETLRDGAHQDLGGDGKRVVISGAGSAQLSSPPPASTRPPPSIETIYCPAVMQPVRTSFCPNGKRNPVPVAPAVFVEAFGNVAREASVLSLDVSQDLQ